MLNESVSPIEQSIAAMVQQGNAEAIAIISSGFKDAAKAADNVRVAMNQMFNVMRNVALELDEMLEDL